MRKQILSIEDAKLVFKNFSGAAGKFNAAGVRNFCVFLEPDVAAQLEKDGWKIRYLQPRDEADEVQPYLSVAVRFDNIPPKIVIISSRGKTLLDEHSVNILDWADIATVDMTISPSSWSVNGNSGIKAYLKSMYVTIVEDEFEKKYYDVPDTAAEAIGGCGNCDTCDGNCGCNEHSTL